MRTLQLIVGALTLAFLAPTAWAEDAAKANPRADHIRAGYTKREVQIPMRDGVKLFTAIYAPNDRTVDHPILMVRTPYDVGPYGLDAYKKRLGPWEDFERSGFIFVFQDVRGRMMSEGTYAHMRPHVPKRQRKKGKGETDESTDTYDTISWLLEHVEGHNGKVGMRGISYPGFYCSAGMIDGHPALVAVAPQAPISDWFWDDMHHHGAFVLPLAFNFLSVVGQPREGPTVEWPERMEKATPDGYQFFLDLGPLSNVNRDWFKGEVSFWNDLVAHPNYDDFWQRRNILPHLKDIRAAVLVVGGWYDTEDLYGPLKTYASIEDKNPRADNRIVMGPWFHGGWVRGEGRELGDADFGFATAETYRERVELRFFEHHLKDKGEVDLPEAFMFETGANRWREFDAWPPKTRETRRLYAREGGRLSFTAPKSTDDAHDAYLSDPHKPVPYTMEITTRWAKQYMAEDQRFAAWRPDVLVYQSDVLKEDVTLAGPIAANLFVSTDQSGADFIVKVIDVEPGRAPGLTRGKAAPRGHQQTLVRAEAIRGRFRESYEHPKAFTPGEITPVSFELLDVLHTFKRGHRIMIHVQSTWFPFIDRNPQRYVPNIFEAKASDFIKATHRIYRSAAHPSHLEVGVIPAL